MRNLYQQKLALASLPAIILAAGLFLLTFQLGKQPLFLLLNQDLGSAADHFFRYFTEAGNGAMWVVVLGVVLFVLKRKDAVWLIVAGFAISTLLTQSMKHLVFPGEFRPARAIADLSQVHVVPGVELHTVDSFPSGHTATAFTIYLLLCLLIPGRWWLLAGGIYASLVAYSRVYLAQHFPVDLAGGILIGVASAWLSLGFQRAVWKRNSNNS